MTRVDFSRLTLNHDSHVALTRMFKHCSHMALKRELKHDSHVALKGELNLKLDSLLALKRKREKSTVYEG
jgi:hypothetical protein